MLQIYKLNVENRKREFLEPPEESCIVEPSHPVSLPYSWTKRSEGLTLLEFLKNPRQRPLHGHDFAVNDLPALA